MYPGLALLDGELSGAAIAGIVIASVAFSAGMALLVMYNRLVNLRQLCRESFSNIDTELQRRHDLIPNLVNVVKGYATHERELLENLTRERGLAAQALSRGHDPEASPRDLRALQRDIAGGERRLGQALAGLMVAVENYPKLKADEQFRRLMTELRNTEDRLQAARRFYNANVRELNNRCQQFPSVIVARLFRFTEWEFFELDNPLAAANVNVAPGI